VVWAKYTSTLVIVSSEFKQFFFYVRIIVGINLRLRELENPQGNLEGEGIGLSV